MQFRFEFIKVKWNWNFKLASLSQLAISPVLTYFTWFVAIAVVSADVEYFCHLKFLLEYGFIP
jgi:hypothetical protein